MTGKRAKHTAHALLFLLAVVVFYIGLRLGVGLQYNPILGSALASAPSFERNHAIPSACFVCRAHVSIRWTIRRRSDGGYDPK